MLVIQQVFFKIKNPLYYISYNFGNKMPKNRSENKKINLPNEVNISVNIHSLCIRTIVFRIQKPV